MPLGFDFDPEGILLPAHVTGSEGGGGRFRSRPFTLFHQSVPSGEMASQRPPSTKDGGVVVTRAASVTLPRDSQRIHCFKFQQQPFLSH